MKIKLVIFNKIMSSTYEKRFVSHQNNIASKKFKSFTLKLVMICCPWWFVKCNNFLPESSLGFLCLWDPFSSPANSHSHYLALN